MWREGSSYTSAICKNLIAEGEMVVEVEMVLYEGMVKLILVKYYYVHAV